MSIIIAIDGFSGCGKSSTAREIAKRRGYRYVDTGAMYRAVTYFFIKNEVDVDSDLEVGDALRKISIEFDVNEKQESELFLNGENIERFLRTMAVNNLVSKVSAHVMVREKLVTQQQELGKKKSIVMDGRDIGTVVFPDAELKVFLTADIEVRAQRRKRQLSEEGIDVSLDEIIENFRKRDRIDSTREVSPLRKAEDAVELDTSNLTFAEQLNIINQLVTEKTNDG